MAGSGGDQTYQHGVLLISLSLIGQMPVCEFTSSSYFQKMGVSGNGGYLQIIHLKFRIFHERNHPAIGVNRLTPMTITSQVRGDGGAITPSPNLAGDGMVMAGETLIIVM